MITKERLDELIKKGATVWSDSFKEEVFLRNYCGFEKIENKLILKIKEFEGDIVYYDVEFLEEDVETAKFKDNYQNITRTETLDLPTWEEFIEKDKDRVKFIAKKGIRYSLACYIDFNTILIFCDGSVVFDKELTKENYLSACELCRKLFLGEVE